MTPASAITAKQTGMDHRDRHATVANLEGGASDTFGSSYADVYDALYEDKDYPGECDQIEKCFDSASDGAVGSILDLGCGTGRHAVIFAERGYQVVGVDRSSAMINQAMRRASSSKARDRVQFQAGDLGNFRAELPFDAALMMFAVLSYQVSDECLRAALRTARANLRVGGIFVFDCWHGPAVLNLRPERRSKRYADDAQRIVRTSSSTLDTQRRCVVVHFEVERELSGLKSSTEETHCMRYFFLPELEDFLKEAGFSLLRVGAMPEFHRAPDETTWNVLGVARAKS